MQKLFLKHPICAILRNVPLEATIPYAKAVIQGGVKLFEVALNSPDGFTQIEMLRQTFENEIIVGAGTVLSPKQARTAQAAGAQFILTPAVQQETLQYCCQNNLPILPGVMTPTDVAQCLSFGISTMKLFPADTLGKGYIKNLKGPFHTTHYVAVGGVTRDNLPEFFQQGFIGVGMGSALFPKTYMVNGQWEDASRWVANLVECCHQNREPFQGNHGSTPFTRG